MAAQSAHPIRLAVVGGRRGGAFNLALEHLKDRLMLAAVCDTSPDVLERWRSEHPGLKTFQNYEQLLAADVCDAVFIATPMQVHAKQAIAALEAGKHVISEVTACVTHDEAVALIDAVERSGLTYMMAENYTYMRPHMMVRNMVEQGVFGELTYAEGMYLHDCRGIKFNDDGSLTWRGEMTRDMDRCHYYPTHSLGPIAQWLDLGGSDRIATVYCVGAPGRCLADYAARRFGEEHPGAAVDYWRRGDSASCLVTTAKDRVISLRMDSASARPHHMTTHELQGTRGCYRTQTDTHEDPLVWLDGRSPGANPPRSTEKPDFRNGDPMKWEPIYQYADQFEHPRWKKWGDMAKKAGHGGGDFFVLEDFVNTIAGEIANPIDVYTAVTWSSLIWLSAESARTGRSVEAINYRALGQASPAAAAPQEFAT